MATITVLPADHADNVVLIFTYSFELMQLFESCIPTQHRSWDPERSVWCAFTDSAEVFLASAEAQGHRILGQRPTRDPPPTPTPAPVQSGRWAMELLAAASPDLRPKIVRSLSKVLHPDLGGDATLMQQLNDAADPWR